MCMLSLPQVLSDKPLGAGHIVSHLPLSPPGLALFSAIVSIVNSQIVVKGGLILMVFN